MKQSFCFLLFMFFNAAISQVQFDPVKWQFSFEKSNEREGDILLSATIEKGWHIYSQFQVGDGPLPTVFQFNKEENIEFLGATIEPKATKTFSEVFGIEVQSFSDKVDFKQKVRYSKKNTIEIQGQVEYMSCNETSCLPPKTIPFVVKIKK